MFMSEITEIIIPPLSALLGVALTILGQYWYAKRNQSYDLEKERIKMNSGNHEKRLWLVRERLEQLHLILGETAREFSLTFMTIDWESGIKRSEYHEKYRGLCVKIEEAQMISDLYLQEVSEDISVLNGNMNCYWGSFIQLLYLEEKGKEIDHNSHCHKDTFEYAQLIPKKVDIIRRKISKISSSIMSNIE